MKKDDLNLKLREYAQTLSPRQGERDLISKIYQSFNDLLGVNNCIQIGSYPRFTAITPIHDLDLLYFLGNWDENSHNPFTALELLNNKINNDYKNSTDYKIKVLRQSHSITVLYLDGDQEIFSVDIVPAYVFSKNNFGDDTYQIPEVAKEKHGKNRAEYYQKLLEENKKMDWIVSDPRGYIKIASDIDRSSSGEFRKTVKIIKIWKNNLKEKDQSLKLKSFHLEQVIVEIFQNNQNYKTFDAIFKFFVDLPNIISRPNQIKDRAYNDKFIDDYIAQLTEEQKEKIKYARDGFLVELERVKDSDSIEKLFETYFFIRKPSEQFLFDSNIQVLTDPALRLRIDGFVEPMQGFSSGWITETPQLQKGITCAGPKARKIKYSIKENNTSVVEYRWKVKNSDNSPQPRGEINIGQTKNNPETTQFPSDSFVECYAISGETCVARGRVNVKII